MASQVQGCSSAWLGHPGTKLLLQKGAEERGSSVSGLWQAGRREAESSLGLVLCIRVFIVDVTSNSSSVHSCNRERAPRKGRARRARQGAEHRYLSLAWGLHGAPANTAVEKRKGKVRKGTEGEWKAKSLAISAWDPVM